MITIAPSSNEESPKERENRQIAYEAACEGIVLLKNSGVLPLKTKKVALYGAGGIRTIKGGTGSGEVNERYSVSILDGLSNGGFDITNRKWLVDFNIEYEKERRKRFDRIYARAKKLQFKQLIDEYLNLDHRAYGRKINDDDIKESGTDTALYVVSRQAGEGADRKLSGGSNDLQLEEIDHLTTLVASYKNVILVINVGSSLDMAFLDRFPSISAIIYFSQLGEEGGNAFADVLTGKVCPSGRLTDTWAMKYEDIPFSNEFSYLSGNLDESYYKEGIFVGYRYFDSFKITPKYEFGYGLSYTTFEISTLSAKAEKTSISVDIKVTNTGNFSGMEVIQLYVSCPQTRLKKEFQRLAAFSKTKTLTPGESQNIKLKFDLKDQGSYSEENGSYLLDEGAYIVRVGQSSRKTKVVALITLDTAAIVSKHDKICPINNAFEEIDAPKIEYNDNLLDVISLKVQASKIDTKVFQYRTPDIYHDDKVDAVMSGLSLKDMTRVVVGSGDFGAKSKFNVPGAVGNTTCRLYHKGLINVALSDGPAGLRLIRHSVIQKDGSTKNAELPYDVYEYLPKFLQNLVMARPGKYGEAYQYCTAFPVEMALAQTWNTDLLYRIGLAVAEEMNRFGVTYWLAPAMNIHRNPLCGRNFEYYSEDPFLSGKMAAAIIKGVQQTPGTYATIKHFCCNNQEDNRNYNNSNVRERALREIYLRGFSIAVEEGGAKAVMTSYNKLNGIYTANCYDTITKVLRNEWGFDGVVMTDWNSTGENKGSNSLCMTAGNDLIMPGDTKKYKDLLKTYKKGVFTKDDLTRCCANVVRSIIYSNVGMNFNNICQNK